MSRRFGRNQRRRAREALAVEVQRVERAERLAKDRMEMYRNASSDLNNMLDFFHILAGRVGRESVLVGGEAEAELIAPDVHNFMMTIKKESPMSITRGQTMESVKHEIMRRLEVESVRDIFRMQTVVRCYVGDSSAGIALSDTFLRRSTEREISHHVAKELAQCLAKSIKEAKYEQPY